MNVSVCVPRRAGDPHRDRSWAWVRARYAWEHPDWQVVVGVCSPGPFNRSEAILDAARQADGDVLLVADSDVWCDSTEAVHEAQRVGWAIPHLLLHRLSEESSEKVMRGADPHGLPLDATNRQDSKPYKGHECGTLVSVRRDVMFDVPPDVRFVGWGSEDDAWALALRRLVGKPWRGSLDLFHLWHPPQPRISRSVGSRESAALMARYRKAKNNPGLMRALVEEGKALWASNASTSP